VSSMIFFVLRVNFDRMRKKNNMIYDLLMNLHTRAQTKPRHQSEPSSSSSSFRDLHNRAHLTVDAVQQCFSFT
jgi:hypothetical protein